MKLKKIWYYLTDNGFVFLLSVFVCMVVYFIARLHWVIDSIKEAWRFSAINGLLLLFGVVIPFIGIILITYITKKEYEDY